MVRKAKSIAGESRNAHSQSRHPVPALSLRAPAEDLIEHAKDYARDRPEVVALWCFGLGFVLGWKLKPW